jgi:signal transduction histidine kinase
MIKQFLAHYTVLLLLVFNIQALAQTRKPAIDSLIRLTESPVDTIRLKALKKLTWDLRFSDPLSAFGYAYDALTLSENLNRPEDLAIIHNYIGVLATKITALDRAEFHILLAYKISDSLNFPLQKAYAMNNLGEIYYHQGKLDSSIVPLQSAIDLFKSINDLSGLAYAYNQMGMAKRLQKKYDEAVNYHKLSLEIRQNTGHAYFVAKTYQNLGIDLLEKGSYAEAREYFNKMDLTNLEHSIYFNPAYKLILIGQTYAGEKDINKAIRFYKDAYRTAQASANYAEMRDAAKLLSDIYNLQNNHQTALLYFNFFKIWDDSVKNSNLKDEHKQLEMRRLFEQQYKYLEYKMNQDIENERIKSYWTRILVRIFIVFMVVLLIFIIIQVRNVRIISKQNKQLLLNKQDIEHKNEELRSQNLQISEQNEAIIKQRDELALANATKDKFFSIIAHDLRGPVGNLTAFFDLIIDSYTQKMDKKLVDFFHIVNESVRQTYTLLENLLTWAQLQNGTISFRPVRNSLFSIVDNNINLLKTKAQEKSIKLVNNIPQELSLVCDTHMIDSVIRNLLSNSLKFTPDNGIVMVSSNRYPDFIEVIVADSGVGMTSHDIDRLFRIDIKHKSKQGTVGERGTGLGLILCKEFVEKHNGKIWVESVPGKGSQFKFLLPLELNK